MYMSEIKESFSNWDDMFELNRTKAMESQKDLMSENTRKNSNSRNDVNNATENKQANGFEIYEIYANDFMFWFSKELNMLLIPKEISHSLRFYNPFNHGQYPFCVTYYRPDSQSAYGHGQVEEIGMFNLMINDFYNLLVEASLKKINPTPIVNGNVLSINSIQEAIDGAGVPIEVEGNADVNQSLRMLNFDFNEGNLAGLIDKLDGYMQLQDAQTDQMTGSTDVRGKNKTLGGLKLIFAQAQQRNLHTNTINSDALKNQLYRMVSNIFQFQKEDIMLKLNIDNKPTFFELKTKFNNSIATETEIIRKNPENNNDIYYLDEMSNIKYLIDIKFATASGNRNERIQDLDAALRIYIFLLIMFRFVTIQ